MIEQAQARNELVMADISCWEIAMLLRKKRVECDATATQLLDLYLQARKIQLLPITPVIAELSVSFGDELSGDPADRLIAATALAHNAQLLTADKNLLQCPRLRTAW